MASPYQVRGGVGGFIPGTLGPAQLDGRAEWAPVGRRAPRDLVEALAARLGSEIDFQTVVLAVLAPLRGTLEGAPLGALLACLPLDLARKLADAELNLGHGIAPPRGAADYVREVSALLLHPPRQAAEYVRAVFAAARAVLRPEDADAVAERLPAELAELWRAAL